MIAIHHLPFVKAPERDITWQRRFNLSDAEQMFRPQSINPFGSLGRRSSWTPLTQQYLSMAAQADGSNAKEVSGKATPYLLTSSYSWPMFCSK
jgi:hypothetical protein